MNPHIIGLTGSFGSGCSYVAENILVPRNYVRFSLSDKLKELFQGETRAAPAGVPRRELQDFGDRLRLERGPDFLAQEVVREILCRHREDEGAKFVVDSIRNPAEVECLRSVSRMFFLMGIYADADKRWNRVHRKYNDNKGAFLSDDQNDTGMDNPAHGQRVGDCFYEADVVMGNNQEFAVVGNDDFDQFSRRIGKYVDLFSTPLRRQKPIRSEEALMTMAYAISQRSSCLKRKVGAIIVDSLNNVISSGFNEVPGIEKPCEGEYNKCYRAKVWDDFFQELSGRVPEVCPREAELKSIFQRQFKILDCCRALHAEENAIVHLARSGSSVPLEGCTLYTTTYPCRMCANKIVQAGIRKVVYLEPYPDPSAKPILGRGGVTDSPFEGVTFKAYFRLYGEQR